MDRNDIRKMLEQIENGEIEVLDIVKLKKGNLEEMKKIPEIKDYLERATNFNEDVYDLANKYNFDLSDVFSNIAGIAFANHCHKKSNISTVDAEREAKIYHQAGVVLLDKMDQIFADQTLDDKLLTLFCAVNEVCAHISAIERVEKERMTHSKCSGTCKSRTANTTRANNSPENEKMNKINDLLGQIMDAMKQ